MKILILRAMHDLLKLVTSDVVYLWIISKLYPIVDKRRYHSSVTFRAKKKYILARDKHGKELAFLCKARASRYIWPEGINAIHLHMRKKYQHPNVRVEAGDVIIDVGANIGEFATAWSDVAKQVICFEPDPRVFTCLERNANVSKNIMVVNQALGERAGEIAFYLSTENADSSIIEPAAYSDIIRVKIDSLKNYVLTRPLGHIDFLKVEAEGYEPEVLAGAEGIQNRIRKVAIDCSPERRGESTLNECKAILEKWGFRVYQTGYMLFSLNDS